MMATDERPETETIPHTDALFRGVRKHAADVVRAAIFGDKPRRPATSEIDETAPMSAPDIAKRFSVSAEPLRKRLDRWRRTHDDGWVEITDRKPREPRYLYRVGAVRHIIDAVRASSETSGECPAKEI